MSDKKIKTWQDRRADWFKRNSQKREGPKSNDQFMTAEIADLRAQISSQYPAPIPEQVARASGIEGLKIERIIELWDANIDHDFGILIEPFARAIEREVMSNMLKAKDAAIDIVADQCATQPAKQAPVAQEVTQQDNYDQAVALLHKLEADANFSIVCMDGTPNVIGIIRAAWQDRVTQQAAKAETGTAQEIIEISVDYPGCRHVAPIKRVTRTDGRLSVLVEGRAPTTSTVSASGALAAADDVRDAGRYRWLRERNNNLDAVTEAGAILFGKRLDQAIDAEMQMTTAAQAATDKSED